MQFYKQVTINNISQDQSDILIALLQNLDYYAFEEQEQCLKAFIDKKDYDAEAIEDLSRKLHFKYNVNEEEEKNWNEIWESNFSPVIVEDFVAVRADFHKPITNLQYEIIITPKMSFGTGHHATTYMMLNEMRNLNFAEKNVFDFGTGTGVLAIFAEKLGAERVYAIDNDEWSIENTKENIKKNKVEKIIVIKRSDAVIDQKFDIILANINKNVLLDNMHALALQLNKKGHLLMSGLLKQDEEDIIREANKYDLQVSNKTHKLQWLLIHFVKT